MASRIHVFDFDGDALFWGQSVFGPAGVDGTRGGEAHNDAEPADLDRPDDTFAPSEPPTVRSARSWLELPDAEEPVEAPRDVEETGEVPAMSMTDASGIVVKPVEEDVIVVEEEEPCPETLRSPVSSGVSTTPRRTRVA